MKSFMVSLFSTKCLIIKPQIDVSQSIILQMLEARWMYAQLNMQVKPCQIVPLLFHIYNVPTN